MKNKVLILCLCIFSFVIGYSFNGKDTNKKISDDLQPLAVPQNPIFSSGENESDNKKIITADVHPGAVPQNPIISYNKYVKFFYSLDKLSFPGYSINRKRSNLGPGVTIIEKELSFGKRQFLTRDGKMDSSKDNSTERVLYFESQDTIFAISVIYTEVNLGRDFLGSDWFTFIGDKRSCSFVFSFDNLIILTSTEGSNVLNDHIKLNELNILLLNQLTSIYSTISTY